MRFGVGRWEGVDGCVRVWFGGGVKGGIGEQKGKGW